MPTMITTGRTISAPYLPRPAGRPGTASAVKASKPGDKVNRKPAFHMNLASYDWRAEVMATPGQPRSLPINSSKGVMMVQRDAIRPRSAEPDNGAGEEVGLEALIEEGKGRREKRGESHKVPAHASRRLTCSNDGSDAGLRLRCQPVHHCFAGRGGHSGRDGHPGACTWQGNSDDFGSGRPGGDAADTWTAAPTG